MEITKSEFFALFSIVLNFLERKRLCASKKFSANQSFGTRRLFYFFESLAKSAWKVSKIDQNDRYDQNVDISKLLVSSEARGQEA